jgi:FkbM family methyltransferase
MNEFEKFLLVLFECVIENTKNKFSDNNYKYYCTGNLKYKIDDLRMLERCPHAEILNILKEKHNELIEQIEYKSFLYNILKNEKSKYLLKLLASYQILGHIRIRFPYYNQEHFQIKKQIIKECSKTTAGNASILAAIQAFYALPTGFFDLTTVGFSLNLYTTLETVYSIHQKRMQYCYNDGITHIAVEHGDIVLDCGACFGDTALIFSEKAGSAGRVISFEPCPPAINIFNANMRANHSAAHRITLVKKGLLDTECTVYMNGISSGSHCTTSATDTKIDCTCIDQEVAELSLKRVDFIKMDIEGSELAALRGAVKTLRAFRPKLAVCLYHRQEDFHVIPVFLQSLDLGYQFYLDHHNVNNYETVLYAYVHRQ